MIDLDPQGNATMGSGVDKRKLELTVYDVLLESASIKEAAVVRKSAATGCWAPTANWPGPRSSWWAGAARKRLKTALAEVATDYDFILIDCPPSA